MISPHDSRGSFNVKSSPLSENAESPSSEQQQRLAHSKTFCPWPLPFYVDKPTFLNIRYWLKEYLDRNNDHGSVFRKRLLQPAAGNEKRALLGPLG